MRFQLKIEIPNIHFSNSGPILPLQELLSLDKITKTESAEVSTPICTIQATDCHQLEKNGPWGATFEAIFPYQEKKIDESFFQGFTGLLDKIRTKITTEPSSLDVLTNERLNWENDTYKFTRLSNDPLKISLIRTDLPIEKWEIHPQFGYTFRKTEDLPLLINRFDPVGTLNMNRYDSPDKGVFTRDPYSGRAEALFIVMFEPFGYDRHWEPFFNVIEFLRLSLGFSMARDIPESDVQRNGVEAYMRILSKTSFRSMFENIVPEVFRTSVTEKSYDRMPRIQTDTGTIEGNLKGILEVMLYQANHLQTDQKISDANPAFEKLYEYIERGFTEPFQSRIPFYHRESTKTLQSVPYLVTDPQKGNLDLVQYYRGKMTLRAILKSILSSSEEAEEMAHTLEEAIDTLFGKEITPKTQVLVNTMINNIKTHDFLSPVPFSLPENPMGYYSRYKSPGSERFMLDIKYIPRFFHEQTDYQPENQKQNDSKPVNKEKCFYNHEFREWVRKEALRDPYDFTFTEIREE